MEEPVIVEQFARNPNYEDSGFPFDDSDNESDHFQSRLNDIASRHPEFATHFRLDDFPSLRRKRQPSTDESSTSSAGQSSRFADHSFPSGFNRFPFTSHFEDEEFPLPRREEKPPEVPKQQDKRGRRPNPNLPQHLSNTVDLGQKQAPVEESRAQRSMSAPPENRTRVEQEHLNHPEDMGKTSSRHQPQQTSQQQTPKERIIPIYIEGRDEPVIPNNPNIGSATPGSRPADPQAQYRRQAYEQFVPKPQQNQQTYQQPSPRQQATPPRQQATPPRQQATPPRQQATPPRQQATPPRQPSTPPPPPQSNDPLDKIKCVRNDVMALMTSVENFAGTRKDREYLYLDEMLTRNLLKLDNVETEGKENIRLARKEAIKCIQTCISNLEAKAQAMEMHIKNSGEYKQETGDQAPETTEELKTVEETTEPPKFTSQATLIISPPQKQQKIEDQPQTVEQMEVDTQTNASDSQTGDENKEASQETKESSQATAEEPVK